MKKIVVVDDEVEICNIFRKVLEKTYNTVTFNNFSEAIEYINNTKIDLLIADYFVPGKLSATDAIKIILKIDKDIKTIIMSGNLNFDKEDDISYIDGIIHKPISISSLLKKVNSIIKE